MGHETYASMLDQLVEARDSGHYRSDPERNEARVNAMESILQTMLEKLRDEFDAD